MATEKVTINGFTNIYPPDGYKFNIEDDGKGNYKLSVEPIEPKAEQKLPETWEEIESRTEYVKAETYWPTMEEYDAHHALAKLLWLRNAWGGRYFTFDETNFRVIVDGALLSSVLAFPNIELRDRFQTTFADLIKTASPLL